MGAFTKVYWLLRLGVDKQSDKNLSKKFKRTAFIFSRDFSIQTMYNHEEQLIFREEMKDAQSVRGAVAELRRKFVKKQ